MPRGPRAVLLYSEWRVWDGINTTEHLQSDTDKAYIHNHDSSSSSPSNNDRETAVSVQTLVSKEEQKKMYGKVSKP